MAALLDKVIANMGVERQQGLFTIKKWVDLDGFYQFAKNHSVLVDNSGEDFAIEFMEAYNNEIAHTY